jgi:hypothetical protein
VKFALDLASGEVLSLPDRGGDNKVFTTDARNGNLRSAFGGAHLSRITLPSRESVEIQHNRPIARTRRNSLSLNLVFSSQLPGPSRGRQGLLTTRFLPVASTCYRWQPATGRSHHCVHSKCPSAASRPASITGTDTCLRTSFLILRRPHRRPPASYHARANRGQESIAPSRWLLSILLPTALQGRCTDRWPDTGAPKSVSSR